MKILLLTAMLASAAKPEAPLEPKKESWATMNMEATAIMGEMKYQHGDLSGARETFRDSLNSSTKILAPQDHVVGLNLYRSAEIAARSGDFPAARRHLDILLNRFPDTEWAERGQRLKDLLPREKGEMLEYEAVTPVRVGDGPETILARIREAIAAGDDAEALGWCRAFIDRHEGDAASHSVRVLGGALYLRLGRPERAARALRHAASRAPDAELRAKALSLLGAALFELGDDAGVLAAIPDMDAAKAANPWMARAQAWRAAAENRLERRQAAAARWRGFIASGVESPLSAYGLAALSADWDRKGKTDEALSTALRARQAARRWNLAELSADLDLNEAHLLFKARRHPQAAAAYADFAARHPGHSQRAFALYQKGIAWRRAGRLQAAAQAFSELSERHPDSVYAPDAHLQLGQAYAELGSPAQALEHYRRMGEGGSPAARKESLLLSAQVHYNAKRFRSAIPLYKQFLDENPGDRRRREVEHLLLTSYWTGDRDNPEMLSAAARYPGHPIIQHMRWHGGVEAYRRGDFAAAAAALGRHAEDYPRSSRAAEALYYQAESLRRLGDDAEAARALGRLRARHPKSPEAAKGARLLSAFAADDLHRRASALSSENRAAEALPLWEAFLRRYPNDSRAFAAHFYRGRRFEELRNPTQAALAYEALRQAKPAASPIRLRGLLRLGLLHELKGRYGQAMPLYMEVMRLSDKDGADFETARKRVQAISEDGLLLRSAKR